MQRLDRLWDLSLNLNPEWDTRILKRILETQSTMLGLKHLGGVDERSAAG